MCKGVQNKKPFMGGIWMSGTMQVSFSVCCDLTIIVDVKFSFDLFQKGKSKTIAQESELSKECYQETWHFGRWQKVQHNVYRYCIFISTFML